MTGAAATADPPDDLVRALLPTVRRFAAGPGDWGIAVGGSHAKGTADALSDVDVYLFAAAVLPAARRDALVRDALGLPRGAVSSWGRNEPFEQGGTDFSFRGRRVECWLRSADWVAAEVEAARRGEIRRTYAAWATSGFFGHVALADLHAMRIVEDPRSLLAGWKAGVAVYPEPLRRALLERFTREAAFWPDNPHYRTAVERADSVYASGIVQQVVQALVQALFALNRVYFPGDKGLLHALDALPERPDALAGRVRALLFPGAEPDPALLEAQRRALAALVAEVEARVEAEAGAG